MSSRFQADADFNFDIVRAVRKREPAIDFVSATYSRLRGVKDPEVLERVVVSNRILVTQDRRTIVLWSVFEPGEMGDHAYHLPSIIRHVFPR